MTYTKEPGYIYIETEEDRKRYAPKDEGDACLWRQDYNEFWSDVEDDGMFSPDFIYRRPIASDDWQHCDEGTVLPHGVTDDTFITEVLCGSSGYRQILYPSEFHFRDIDTSHYRLIELIPAPAAKFAQTQLQKDQDRAVVAGFWPGDQIAAFVSGAEYGRNDRHETCG